MREADIQNAIRLHVSARKLGILFRANVGEGWTGNKDDIHYDRINNILTIRNPRRLSTGLPPGFSDLFGVIPGGRAVFIEVKSLTGRATPEQEKFLGQMAKAGACAGVARSPEDAEKILTGR